MRETVPSDHLLLPNEASSIRNVLHLIELLAKGSHGNPQITQAVAMTIGCFPDIDRKALEDNTYTTH